MPYGITAACSACSLKNEFIIGDWTRYFGVYICPRCKAFVNIPVDTGKCPGCGHQPQPADLYDYSRAIPYLGGQTPFPLDAGPACPQCQQKPVVFDNHLHLNMGAVVFNEAGAKATDGKDFMEKAIFMNSTVPVIQELQLDPAKVFAYFHLHIPTAPLLTRRWSFPIAMDIRTHLNVRIMMSPNDFRSDTPQPPVQ